MMRLTIIGFGNQAQAWALNLKDSGFPVRVALRSDSPSLTRARELNVDTVVLGSEDFFQDSHFALLTPDDSHDSFMKTHGTSFKKASMMLYAHGFSLVESHFDKTYPQIDHVLFAPKAIGSELRRQFQIKGMLGAVYSLEKVLENQDEKQKWLMNLSRSLGITMGPFKTSFERETMADLYSEQGLLCSLIPYTASEMFNHLVESGVEPELAYFECWHELKLIINAMVDKGPEGFFDLISPNALIGSEKGYKRLMNDDFKANLQSLFTDIKRGTFNQELKQVDLPELRHTIRNRWSGSPLMKTFTALQGKPRE